MTNEHAQNEEVVNEGHAPAHYRVHLLQMQLRWACQVTTMKDVRTPKAVIFNELQEGKRDRGAQRMRYEDQLKRQLAQAGTSHQSWQQEASDRHSCAHQ